MRCEATNSQMLHPLVVSNQEGVSEQEDKWEVNKGARQVGSAGYSTHHCDLNGE
jgi:hypothetical protein